MRTATAAAGCFADLATTLAQGRASRCALCENELIHSHEHSDSDDEPEPGRPSPSRNRPPPPSPGSGPSSPTRPPSPTRTRIRAPPQPPPPPTSRSSPSRPPSQKGPAVSNATCVAQAPARSLRRTHHRSCFASIKTKKKTDSIVPEKHLTSNPPDDDVGRVLLRSSQGAVRRALLRVGSGRACFASSPQFFFYRGVPEKKQRKETDHHVLELAS